MLVLSRRPSQKIVFPELGITIQVVQSSSSGTRLGISAPTEIKVLREEIYEQMLAEDPDVFSEMTVARKSEQHALKNRLNAANMALHLARRHLKASRQEEAQLALDRAVGEFRDLNYLAKTRGTSPIRVLLVEDDSNERELLKGYLRSSGYDVAAVEDGQAAIDYLSSEFRPDVVLLDMLMPNVNGMETIEKIRETPHLDGLKVFAVSGTDPADVGIEIGPRGVDGWFGKPLDPEKLVQALTCHLTVATAA